MIDELRKEKTLGSRPATLIIPSLKKLPINQLLINEDQTKFNDISIALIK